MPLKKQRSTTPKKRTRRKIDTTDLESSSSSSNDEDDTLNQVLSPLNEAVTAQQDQEPDSNTLIPSGVLPAYLAQAFGDLYEQDGLCVLGKGLGWLLLLASLVRFYADLEEGHAQVQHEEEVEKARQERRAPIPKAKKPPLVLVLGLKDATERQALLDILSSWGTPPEMLPTMITNEAGQGKDRQQLYQRGGVFCITSRILIVDLLSGGAFSNNVIASPDDIAGIIVAHAESVTETSTEAFILRIYQSQKQPYGSGFCKAISDAPETLQSGFAKVDKILKALHVRKLYLYPRFHDSIRDELEGDSDTKGSSSSAKSSTPRSYPPHVIELHQGLTRNQVQIQAALAAAVQACIREIKKNTTLLDFNDETLSVENCVTTSFDRTVAQQLEHDWHRLKPTVKQLVQDLRTLRTLFQALLHYDCVSFYRLLQSLQSTSAANRFASMWILSPAGDVIYRLAKERVYKLTETSDKTARKKKKGGTQDQDQGQDQLTSETTSERQYMAVLEENPKWKLLRQVMEEVTDDYKERKKQRPANYVCNGPTNVLVMVQDYKTLDACRSYLAEGHTSALAWRWMYYLEQVNDRSRSLTGGQHVLSEESRWLLREENRVRKEVTNGNDSLARAMTSRKKSSVDDKKNDVKAKSKSKETAISKKNDAKLNAVPQYDRKRRKVAAERGRGKDTRTQDDLAQQDVLDGAIDATEHEMQLVDSNDVDDDDMIIEVHDSFGDKEYEHPEDALFQVTYQDELRINIKTFASIEGDRALMMLQDWQPDYIVLYDANVAFIRGVEMYAALTPTLYPIKIYFLMYEASAEEKVFVRALEREQQSFEKLIEHKLTMPAPVLNNFGSQEVQQARENGNVGGTYANGALPLAFDTRKGRGKLDTSKERRNIAVDVREFRSALPSILHQGGMRLAPVTLTVGDFVLSNAHCVERKSISDLFGSFASGRLYTQAESMCKYYPCPCLLIEFDPEKSFSLQNVNELGVEVRKDAISTKLALLTMQFPKLRILWSRSPHETLRIFRELKTSHDEVDVDKAVEVGRQESIDALLTDGAAAVAGDVDDDAAVVDEINTAARDILLRIPGVNVPVARKIMQNVDSLAELADMSLADLKRILGPMTGQKLYKFFRQRMNAM